METYSNWMRWCKEVILLSSWPFSFSVKESINLKTRGSNLEILLEWHIVYTGVLNQLLPDLFNS